MGTAAATRFGTMSMWACWPHMRRKWPNAMPEGADATTAENAIRSFRWPEGMTLFRYTPGREGECKIYSLMETAKANNPSAQRAT